MLLPLLLLLLDAEGVLLLALHLEPPLLLELLGVGDPYPLLLICLLSLLRLTLPNGG